MSCSTSRRGLLYSLIFAVTLLLGLTGVAEAQQVFGSIYGNVTDPSGSAVNNAKVTITDTNKQTSFVVTTNDSGTYTKGQLIPDPYQVTIEAPGFQKTVSNDVQVSVDASVQFNAKLQVGNMSQQIEVTAAAPLLQTDRADISQTFSSQQISQIPSIGRNLQSFELLNPGTVKLSFQHATSENPQGGVQALVNGQYISATGYELDGTTNQDPILGIIVINPTFDSVNEVKQSNQDFDAEFEYTGGGLLAYSTKSGTNSFHGDVFEYNLTNTPGFSTFGRNPFSEPNGAPPFHQNQFGGSLGGRVIKDKLFFFADAQLTRQSLGGSVLTTVPTAAERTGDLSDWLAAGRNSSNGVNPYIIYDPTTRQPFPNNRIPQNRLNPQALALLNYLPLPNSNAQGTVYQNNYVAQGSDSINGNQWNTRWDYYGNEKNTFFGRYSYAAYDQSAPGAFGLLAGGPAFSGNRFAGQSNALNQSGAAGWTHTFNPTLINEFRFGYLRYHVNTAPNGFGTQPAAQAGIPGLNLDTTFTSGLPAFFINEVGGGGNNTNGSIQLGYALGINGCNCPLTEIESQYQFVDNVSKIAGNHTLKFGFDGRYARNLRVPSDAHRSGELSFDPGYTGADPNNNNGLGLATFLLGDVTNFRRYVSSNTNAQERQKRLFFYGQDTWHITPKLTFNYGLRWEVIFPETVNGAGNGAQADLRTGNLDVFGLGPFSSHGYQSFNAHLFAPRGGIAYQVTPKTVIRAGYGWSYNLGTFGSIFGHNVTQNPPVLSIQNLTQTTAFNNVFSLQNGPNPPQTLVTNPLTGTIPVPNGIEVKTRPLQLTLPVVYLYNFAIQQQVTNKVSVTASYVGNQGRHAFLGFGQQFNVNEPNYIPGLSEQSVDVGKPYFARYGWTQPIDFYCNCSNSRYDSFQALFKVNALAGLNLQGNYTYQISQGDGNGPYNTAYYFLYDRPGGWNYADQVPHQQWVIVPNYDIPFGKGRKFGSHANRIVDLALGGWNVSGITTYYSGSPFSPTIGGYPGAPPVGPNNRPIKGTGDPYAGALGNRDQWFVGGLGTSFLAPGSQQFGNYPANRLYGPHFINQDLSLMKVFAFTERFRFTLRTDATNIFNHTNLDVPNNNVTSATAGQITQTAFGGSYNLRRLQFSGTLNF